MNIQIFSNPVFGQVRTTTDEKGTVWFVGKDVAEILGYVGAANAVAKHVSAEDKGVIVLMTPGGNQPFTAINESGLYSLILSSKLPQAQDFKRWVTGEVLPQIRKTGGYIPIEKDDDEKLILCKAVQILQRTVEQRDSLISVQKEHIAEQQTQIDCQQQQLTVQQTQIDVQQQQLTEQAPQVAFAQAVTASEDSILMRDLAKLITQSGYPIGQNRLFYWLRLKKYIFRQDNGDHRPYQNWVERGLFTLDERTYTDASGNPHLHFTVRVTGKGQRYFIEGFTSGRFSAENGHFS